MLVPRRSTLIHLKRLICSFATVLLLCACLQPLPARELSVLDLQLTHPATVRELVDDESTTIVLLQAPETCLACSADLFQWQDLARQVGGTLAIVLTDEPSSEQVREFRLRRLEFSVARSGMGNRAKAVAPAIAVFQRGEGVLVAARVSDIERAGLLDSAKTLLFK